MKKFIYTLGLILLHNNTFGQTIQRLMPQVENTSTVIEAGTSSPNLLFYYNSVTTLDGQRAKMLTATFLGGSTSGIGSAGIDIQVMRIKRERLAEDGEAKHPSDVCIVDYGRLRPYDPTQPGAPLSDNLRWPTFILQYGDKNHTDCGPDITGFCRDPNHPKRLIQCPTTGGNGGGGGIGPTGTDSERDLISLPEAAFSTPTAVALSATVSGSRAMTMLQQLKSIPVKRKFELAKREMLNALYSQTPEGTAEIIYAVINKAYTGQPTGSVNQRDLDSGIPGTFPNGSVVEPSAEWCSTRNWNYTYRHLIAIWQGAVRFRGIEVCDGPGVIKINKGRCSHAATVMMNWNPCSGEPFHVTGMQSNHGRRICIDNVVTGLPEDECTNGLHRTAWYVSCPYRTYSMAYATRRYCGTFYSAWSNSIPTPAVRLECAICLFLPGHNCNDDGTYQWWNVAHWATADPIYGPPAVPGFTAGLECANEAPHFDLTAADRTSPECPFTGSCTFSCP